MACLDAHLYEIEYIAIKSCRVSTYSKSVKHNITYSRVKNGLLPRIRTLGK
jgi:hypothetical protein